MQDVYKIRNVCSVKCKINSIDETAEHLYVGDTNGNIYKYFLNRKETDFMRETTGSMTGGLTNRQVTSSKIDVIKVLAFTRDILVLSN